MSFNAKPLFFILRPFGEMYAQLMRSRRFAYEHGLMKRFRPEVPVISVGNLAMGGSGKTPLVIHLARLLLGNGCKPAVVSRGYGGKAKKPVNIVADMATIMLDSEQAGDEPRLIAESVPGIAVLTGVDRRFPCLYAVNRLGCDAIILDDGFQHQRLLRDMDIVVFNASELYEDMHVFPGGFLREPLSALKSADCFILSGCTQANKQKVDRFSRYLKERHPRTPLFHARFVPRCWVAQNGETLPLDHLPFPAAAFCGIASPDRFKNTLAELKIPLAVFKSFPDHHRYSLKDKDSLEDLAARHQARCLLTTEKDLVKLAGRNWSIPVLALRMEVAVPSSFDKLVLEMLGSPHDQTE